MKLAAVVLCGLSAAGCSSGSSRLAPPTLFASTNAAPSTPIESRDLAAPVGVGSSAPASVTTPSALAARGYTLEGASVVAVTAADTPTTLSQGFGVPIDVILAANKLSSPSEITPGQRLIIPTFVRADDRPVEVARVATDTMTDATPEQLQPRGAPSTTLNEQAAQIDGGGAKTHRVQTGDTLYGIARRNGVTPEAIQRANGLPADGSVRIGQLLTIPGGVGAAGTRGADGPDGATITAGTEPTPPQTEVASVDRSVQPKTEPRIAEPTQRAETPSEAAKGFRWPVKGRILSGFGRQSDGVRNDGINLAVPAGTPVKAAEAGTVIYAGNELEGYGNLVLIQHEDDWVSAYAHNADLKVNRGDSVTRGQAIATVGQTGSVDVPQLHFELRKRSKPVDPLPHLAG